MHAHLGNGTFDGLDEIANPIPNAFEVLFSCDARWLGTPNPYRIFWGAIDPPSCDINYAYSTVVVHEYGHYLAWLMMGIAPDVPHQQFHEGFGDTLAMLVYGVTVEGEDLGAECTPQRSPLEHTPTPLFDCNLPSPHGGGMLLSAIWLELADDNALGLAATRQLFADWSQLTSGGVGDGPAACPTLPKAAGPPTLLEVLSVDDDNNNLADGTPNYDTICRVFEDRLIFLPPELPSCGDSAGSRPCLPDTNFDGILDIFDALTFQEWFVAGDPAADFNGDGGVDLSDFLLFERLFQEGC